jgi:hypothetical protein
VDLVDKQKIQFVTFSGEKDNVYTAKYRRPLKSTDTIQLSLRKKVKNFIFYRTYKFKPNCDLRSVSVDNGAGEKEFKKEDCASGKSECAVFGKLGVRFNKNTPTKTSQESAGSAATIAINPTDTQAANAPINSQPNSDLQNTNIADAEKNEDISKGPQGCLNVTEPKEVGACKQIIDNLLKETESCDESASARDRYTCDLAKKFNEKNPEAEQYKNEWIEGVKQTHPDFAPEKL